MVKAFIQNLKQNAVAFGRRLNTAFNSIKTHTRNTLPFFRKASMLAAGLNKYTNLPYVDLAARAVHSGTYAAEGLLNKAENLQKHFGLNT